MEHRSWRLRHEVLQRATNASRDALNEFVANNIDKVANSAACEARVNESKKVLDDLIDEVKTLDDEVKEKQKVLATEAEAMDEVEESVKDVKDEHEDELSKCAEQKKEAITDLAKYTKQKDELDAIAGSAETGAVSLLAFASAFDRQKCLAFLQFTRRVRITKARQDHEGDEMLDAPTGDECDEKRIQLQEDFAETYDEVEELVKDATARAEDPTCKDAADAKKDVALAPLKPQQEEAAEQGEKASKDIANLKPVLEKTKKRVEEVKDHIDNDVAPECVEAEKVVETLNKIKDELVSLENCPKAPDFKLQIPGINANANEGKNTGGEEDDDQNNEEEEEGNDEGETEEEANNNEAASTNEVANANDAANNDNSEGANDNQAASTNEVANANAAANNNIEGVNANEAANINEWGDSSNGAGTTTNSATIAHEENNAAEAEEDDSMVNNKNTIDNNDSNDISINDNSGTSNGNNNDNNIVEEANNKAQEAIKVADDAVNVAKQTSNAINSNNDNNNDNGNANTKTDVAKFEHAVEDAAKELEKAVKTSNDSSNGGNNSNNNISNPSSNNNNNMTSNNINNDMNAAEADGDNVATETNNNMGELEIQHLALTTAQETVKSVEEEHNEALIACKKEQQLAEADLAKYKRNRDELEAIAAASGASFPVSLLEHAVKFNRQSCLAFDAFVNRATREARGKDIDPSADKKSCDVQRKDLLQAFDKAYLETSQLIKKTQEVIEDQTCKESADARKAISLAKLRNVVMKKPRRDGKLENNFDVATEEAELNQLKHEEKTAAAVKVPVRQVKAPQSQNEKKTAAVKVPGSQAKAS